MFKFGALNRDCIFLNISEVRQQIAGLVRRIKKYRVVVMKNGKPAMMIVDFEDYQKLQEALELKENDYFADVARQRTAGNHEKTYSHAEVVKRFKKCNPSRI